MSSIFSPLQGAILALQLSWQQGRSQSSLSSPCWYQRASAQAGGRLHEHGKTKWEIRRKSQRNAFTRTFSNAWKVQKSETNEQHLIVIHNIQSAESTSYTLKVWQGNRSPLATVLPHTPAVSRCRTPPPHTHTHTLTQLWHKAAAFASARANTCQCSQPPGTHTSCTQTHTHNYTRSQLFLYANDRQRLHAVCPYGCAKSASARIYMWLRVNVRFSQRAAGRESGAIAALHSPCPL